MSWCDGEMDVTLSWCDGKRRNVMARGLETLPLYVTGSLKSQVASTCGSDPGGEMMVRKECFALRGNLSWRR